MLEGWKRGHLFTKSQLQAMYKHTDKAIVNTLIRNILQGEVVREVLIQYILGAI